MPRGPKGEKRPADVIGNAVRVMEVATGQRAEEFDRSNEGKDAAAQALGKKGGEARAKALGKRKRSEIAKNAAAKRWSK